MDLRWRALVNVEQIRVLENASGNSTCVGKEVALEMMGKILSKLEFGFGS
jgi:hypothetical protein